MISEELKQENQQDTERDFSEFTGEKLFYLKTLYNMGFTTDQAINIMIWLTLQDISDTLGTEEFRGMAESLNALSECIGYMPPNYFRSKGYHFLRIMGNIDTN